VGPNGKTFSKDSSSKSITIDGLAMGTWTISASGYNSDSVKIVSGSKTFLFDNSSSSVSVQMSTCSGTGSLQISLSWDSKIADSKLKISMLKDGEKTEDIISISSGSSSYTYSKSNLDSGTYLLIAQIYSNDSLVAGMTEVTSIINNKTTSGSISLKAASGSVSYQSSSSYFSGQFAVSGCTSLPSELEANKSLQISYVLNNKTLNNSNLTWAWYLNGTLVSNSSTYSPASMDIGDYILSVVVSNSIKSESFFYKFSVKAKAKKGSAILASTISYKSTKLTLASDTLLGALPGGHFILVSPSRSTMQLFSIYKNTVSTTSDSTYNATDMRFTWLPQVTKIYTNPSMNFFAMQTEQNCLHILYFNQKTEKIELALWNEEPLCLTDFVSFPPAFFDNITTVSLIPSGDYAGMIFIFDSGDRSKELFGIQTTASEIKNLGTSSLLDDMKIFVCSDGFSELLGTVTDADVLKFANVKNGTLTSAWYSFSDDKISDIKSFKFLNSRYAFLANDSTIKIYEYYSQRKIWVSRTTVNQDNKCICLSSDSAYIYTSDSEGALLTYKSGLSDSFGKIYTQETDEPITQLEINNLSVLGLDDSGNLYIFEIVQEDSSL